MLNLKPLITEKSLKSVERSNEYTFLTDRHVDKFKVREAVQEMFGVKVLEVRSMVARGKTKKHGKKHIVSRQQDQKFVVVRLAPKDKIDLFETKEQSEAKSKSKSKKKE